MVPENGLIALNVPLDPLRLGSNSIRTTHPYHGKVERPARRTRHRRGDPEPYWDKSERRDGRGLSQPALLEEAGVGLSVVFLPPGSAAGTRNRALRALLAVPDSPCGADGGSWGNGSDATTYTVPDLRAQPLDTRESPGKQVRSFQYAIERLKGDRSYEPL